MITSMQTLTLTFVFQKLAWKQTENDWIRHSFSVRHQRFEVGLTLYMYLKYEIWERLDLEKSTQPCSSSRWSWQFSAHRKKSASLPDGLTSLTLNIDIILCSSNKNSILLLWLFKKTLRADCKVSNTRIYSRVKVLRVEYLGVNSFKGQLK